MINITTDRMKVCLGQKRSGIRDAEHENCTLPERYKRFPAVVIRVSNLKAMKSRNTPSFLVSVLNNGNSIQSRSTISFTNIVNKVTCLG